MNNLNASLHLFTFKGIPFKAHWTLILLSVIYLFKDNDPISFKYNLATVVILVISVIVHELGHALTARKVGGRAHEIVLWPLGGLAYTSGHGTLKNSLKVTLGGPLTHIPLALVFAAPAVFMEGTFSWHMLSPFLSQVPATQFWSYIFIIGAKLQIILFLLNLFVPAYPLDCGHVIVKTMLIKKKSPELTAKVIVGLSAVAAAVLIFVFNQIFVAAFILFETWQLNNFRTKGQLRRHPLFHMALSMPTGVETKLRAKHLKVVKKKETSGKTCPTCKRVAPPGALMCGFCEKEI